MNLLSNLIRITVADICLDVLFKQMISNLTIPPKESIQFFPGDVVILNSGSSLMTIDMITANNAHCVWFDRDNKLCRRIYPLACIMLATSINLSKVERFKKTYKKT